MGQERKSIMKVDNYDYKLIEWVNTQLRRPYIWGDTDCGSVVRKGLNIIYGKDKFNAISTWDSEEICRKIWDDLGGVDKAFLDFGAKKIKRTYAQTGDVAVLEIGKLLTAAMVISCNKLLFSSTDKGVETRDITPSLLKLNIRFYRFG